MKTLHLWCVVGGLQWQDRPFVRKDKAHVETCRKTEGERKERKKEERTKEWDKRPVNERRVESKSKGRKIGMTKGQQDWRIDGHS